VTRIWQLLNRHARLATGLMCVLLFGLASAVCLSTRDQLRYPDERDYHQLALHLRSGDGYVNEDSQPTAFRPPGYPLVLGFLYRLTPSPLAAKTVNALALAFTAWLLSLLVARVVPEGRPFAAFLFLLYPLFLYAASTLYPQTVGTLLWVAALVCLLRATRRDSNHAVNASARALTVFAARGLGVSR
jgi:hypothetical protein